MGYDYKNILGSVKKVEDEEQAKNGLLPEGTYTFNLVSVEKGNENTSKARVWIFKCQIIAPKTIYDRVERQIRFSERQDYYAREDYKRLIGHLIAWGADLNNWIHSEEEFHALLCCIADNRIRLTVNVENQEDKDGNVSKYQKFLIDESKFTKIDFSQFLADQGIEGQGDEQGQEEEVAPPPPPVAPAPVAKKRPISPYQD